MIKASFQARIALEGDNFKVTIQRAAHPGDPCTTETRTYSGTCFGQALDFVRSAYSLVRR